MGAVDISVLTALQNSSIHQALSGMSLSGQAVKWNCVTGLAFSLPCYGQRLIHTHIYIYILLEGRPVSNLY